MAARTWLSPDADTRIGDDRERIATKTTTIRVGLLFIDFIVLVGCFIGRDLCSQLRSIAEKPSHNSQRGDYESGGEIVAPKHYERDEQERSSDDCPRAFSHRDHFTSIR